MHNFYNTFTKHISLGSDEGSLEKCCCPESAQSHPEGLAHYFHNCGIFHLVPLSPKDCKENGCSVN